MLLSTLSSNTPSQLDVFRHDSDALGVNGAQVCVFEEADKVRFGSLLQGTNSCTLETQISLEILCNLTNEALEWQFADKQLCGFLITTNLTKSDSTRPNL